MKPLPAEDYYRWQVNIGYYHSFPPGSRSLSWHTSGDACLVHPQIALTSFQIWKEWEEERRGKSELKVQIGETEYSCQLGHKEPDRNLVALVLNTPARDAEGKAFKVFPKVADGWPKPGQTLGVVTGQSLRGQTAWDDVDHYLCYTFGKVSLLRAEKKLLHGLSGLETRQHHFGKAVFDEDGKLYGVTTDYLHEPYFDRSVVDDVRTGYLVFSPVTSKIKHAAEMVVKQLK